MYRPRRSDRKPIRADKPESQNMNSAVKSAAPYSPRLMTTAFGPISIIFFAAVMNVRNVRQLSRFGIVDDDAIDDFDGFDNGFLHRINPEIHRVHRHKFGVRIAHALLFGASAKYLPEISSRLFFDFSESFGLKVSKTFNCVSSVCAVFKS